MNLSRITRKEFNRLMEIPEAREIYEANMLQLKLTFKHRMEHPGAPDPSNLIYLDVENRGPTTTKKKNSTRIVDTENFRNKEEEDQINTFMEYFNNHPFLRKAILDEFFLRILPFNAMDICKDA